MKSYEKGFLAGCVATLPMTLAMVVMHRFLPKRERYPLPPTQITENLMEKTGIEKELNSEEKKTATWLNHFLFGATAGALYAPLVGRLPLPGAVKGTLYGLSVWSGSYLGWLPAAGILRPATQQPARRNALMIAAHVIWGAAAGILVERLEEVRV